MKRFFLFFCFTMPWRHRAKVAALVHAQDLCTMYVCVCVCVCVCMCVCIYIGSCGSTHAQDLCTMYVCVCIYVCMCVYICIYIYIGSCGSTQAQDLRTRTFFACRAAVALFWRRRLRAPARGTASPRAPNRGDRGGIILKSSV